MIENIILIIGISGIIAVGLQFFLEATNRLGKDHKAFAWINLYGCTALFINAFFSKVWLFASLNVLLISIGLYGLYIVYFKNKKDKKSRKIKTIKITN